MNTSTTPLIHSHEAESGESPLVRRVPLSDLIRLLRDKTMSKSDAPSSATQLTVGLRRVAAGAHLMLMGAPSNALYFVCTGTFKIFRTDEDGYEQVLAFSGRRDVVGFDALCMETHPTAASALEDSTVYVIRKSELPLLSRAEPALERELQRAGSRALTRTNDLVDVMAAVAAEVRLARFLLQLSRQMAASGQSPRRFHLRMGRRDIASMLCVAHETVSRSFTALSLHKILAVHNREVEILEMDVLRTFSRSTRKGMDEGGMAAPRRRIARQPEVCRSMGLRVVSTGEVNSLSAQPL